MFEWLDILLRLSCSSNILYVHTPFDIWVNPIWSMVNFSVNSWHCAHEGWVYIIFQKLPISLKNYCLYFTDKSAGGWGGGGLSSVTVDHCLTLALSLTAMNLEQDKVKTSILCLRSFIKIYVQHLIRNTKMIAGKSVSQYEMWLKLKFRPCSQTRVHCSGSNQFYFVNIKHFTVVIWCDRANRCNALIFMNQGAQTEKVVKAHLSVTNRFFGHFMTRGAGPSRSAPAAQLWKGSD